jgi:hypothetical protein
VQNPHSRSNYAIFAHCNVGTKLQISKIVVSCIEFKLTFAVGCTFAVGWIITFPMIIGCTPSPGLARRSGFSFLTNARRFSDAGRTDL